MTTIRLRTIVFQTSLSSARVWRGKTVLSCRVASLRRKSKVARRVLLDTSLFNTILHSNVLTNSRTVLFVNRIGLLCLLPRMMKRRSHPYPMPRLSTPLAAPTCRRTMHTCRRPGERAISTVEMEQWRCETQLPSVAGVVDGSELGRSSCG